MTTQSPDIEAWEKVAVQAQDLSRADRPDEAARLLASLAMASGSGGYAHETALAWIEVSRAYLRANRRGDSKRSLTEAQATVATMKEGVTWEANACRIHVASVLRELGDDDEAIALIRQAATESSQCQHDVDCVKNICAAGRLLAEMGRYPQAREVLALLTNQQLRSSELARLGDG